MTTWIVVGLIFLATAAILTPAIRRELRKNAASSNVSTPAPATPAPTTPAGGTPATSTPTATAAPATASPATKKKWCWPRITKSKVVTTILLVLSAVGLYHFWQGGWRLVVPVEKVPVTQWEQTEEPINFIPDFWDGTWGRKKVARLEKGVTYRIDASGQFLQGFNDNGKVGLTPVTPKGVSPDLTPYDRSNIPVKDAWPYALVGLLGGDKPFLIGEYTEVTPAENVELWLTTNVIQSNDGDFGYNKAMPDGSGWRIMIKRKKG